MNIADSKIDAIIDIVTKGDTSRKTTFHRAAQEYLQQVASDMLLPEGSFDIRVNKGGFAVLGEVILHSDTLYVCLGGSVPLKTFYFRKVKGRKDYCGGNNNHLPYTALREPFKVVKAFENVRA